MYTSSKRQHVNAFASRFSGWFPRLFFGIRIARLRDSTNHNINNTRRLGGRISIGDGHGFGSCFVVQWILNVSHVWISVRTLIDQSKLFLVVREICPPRRSFRSSRSSKACAEPDQPIDRASLSVGGAHNGLSENLRRCSRRIQSGQSDMKGCRPASGCTVGTS